MIRALLLSVVRAAELGDKRTISPELTAGLLLREMGTHLAIVHARRVVELLEAAAAEPRHATWDGAKLRLVK